MVQAVALTLAEAAAVLEPPMAEQQLRQIVTALGWQPSGWRPRGGRGHPWPEYDAAQIIRLHAALLPFLPLEGLLCA
jgi:hypothetical protein